MNIVIDEGGWTAKVDYGYDDAMEELEFDIVSLEPRDPSLFGQIIEMMDAFVEKDIASLRQQDIDSLCS